MTVSHGGLEFALATESDVDLLREMAIAFHIEDGHPLDGPAIASVALLASGEASARAWIARYGGVPVGYTIVAMSFDIEYGGRDGFITDLYLKPSVRGQGLGRTLLDFAVSQASTLGIRTLHLEVERHNQKAAKLYRTFGFEDTGRSLMRLGLRDSTQEIPTLMPAQTRSPASIKTICGGCQCGAVRYRFTGVPGAAVLCHCRMCQKAGGNWGLPLVSLSAANFIWTNGAPAEFRSSPVVARGFCARCGTPLYMREDGDPNFEVTIGSLDEPQSIQPERQVGIEGRWPWLAWLMNLPALRTDQERAVADLAKLRSNQHPDWDADESDG